METEHWIALTGIVISAVIAYFTAKATISAERRKGRLILLELIKQYLISFNSCFDIPTKSIKTDRITKEQYLRMIEIIESEFRELISNPYYLDITFKYPTLTMLQVSFTREIAELENSDVFGLKEETFRLMLQLYSRLKKDMRKKYFKKGGGFFEIDKLIFEWKEIFKL